MIKTSKIKAKAVSSILATIIIIIIIKILIIIVIQWTLFTKALSVPKDFNVVLNFCCKEYIVE